jgi:Fe-coproporphyrin III synthase
MSEPLSRNPTIRTASAVRHVAEFAWPFLRYRLNRVPSPVLAGYKITHRCNLRCRHCPYWNRVGPERDFSGVLETLGRLSRMGVKILILEGGEPLLWRDGRKNLRHVVDAARKLFASVCMTTNGLLPWGDLALDRVWVSLDGPPEAHDRIRGPGVAQRVMENLEREGRGESFISTTINSENFDGIPDMVMMLRGLVAGITIQFHYPYAGLPDPFFVPHERRVPLLDELIRLKRAGYPVANSLLSLEDLKKEGWICEDKLLANAEPDGSVFHGCYLKNRGKSDCSVCGFSAHNEMSLAFHGRWESIRTGMKIFFG